MHLVREPVFYVDYLSATNQWTQLCSTCLLITNWLLDFSMLQTSCCISGGDDFAITKGVHVDRHLRRISTSGIIPPNDVKAQICT
jgi:hypothetical protein